MRNESYNTGSLAYSNSVEASLSNFVVLENARKQKEKQQREELLKTACLNSFSKNGAIMSTMTATEWRDIVFPYMKMQSKDVLPGASVTKIFKNGKSNNDSLSEDSISAAGISSWQTYKIFLADIIKNIRSKNKKVDYCFFFYHIADLLKLEPNLHATWNQREGYFSVWLDRYN